MVTQKARRNSRKIPNSSRTRIRPRPAFFQQQISTPGIHVGAIAANAPADARRQFLHQIGHHFFGCSGHAERGLVAAAIHIHTGGGVAVPSGDDIHVVFKCIADMGDITQQYHAAALGGQQWQTGVLLGPVVAAIDVDTE